MTYGLADNIAQAFHGTVDYRGAGEGGDNSYHDAFQHEASDSTAFFGQFSPSVFGDNTVQTSCLL